MSIKKTDPKTSPVEASPENCTHTCSTCGASCPSRNGTATPKNDFSEPMNALSNVKNVVGVVSGKGGVGKSLVTGLLAVKARREGREVAILDADITGPSVPKMFGLRGEVKGCEEGMFPLKTNSGIGVMSANLLLDNESAPIVWRGPVIAGTVKQFWSGVLWGEIDTMYVDMPPGTGDVPLTVFQSLPVSGIVVVTTPQELVSMIVEKALNMAAKMHIPVFGIIENMSYALCPDCGRKIEIYGPSHAEEVAARHNVPFLGRLPISPKIAALCDAGEIENITEEILGEISL